MHFKPARMDSLLDCFLEKQLSKISAVSKIMQYHSPAILVIRQCPKLFFERFYPAPVHTHGEYGAEFVVFQLGPDIRNNSRNKNIENNSVPVRGTGRKAENGKRMKIQKMG